MTRKDYDKFAAMFAGELALAASSSNDVHRAISHGQVFVLICSTADIFAQDNPRFDRDRFYDACGL